MSLLPRAARFHVGKQTLQLLRFHAVIVDVDADPIGARAPQAPEHPAIGLRLDDHRIAGLYQHRVDQIEHLQRARGDQELAYQAKIKPDCDWILRSFDQRAEARAAEAAGLTSAKDGLNVQGLLD